MLSENYVYTECNMFLEEDLDPKTKKPKLRNLDIMSVAELTDYKAQLQEEILRVDAVVAKKGDSKSVADSFFKKPE